MPSGLVFVDEAFDSHAVEHRNDGLVGVLGGIFVAAIDGFDDALDQGAHVGATTFVGDTALFGLSSAFAGLGGIGQCLSPVGLLSAQLTLCPLMTAKASPFGMNRVCQDSA